jgi:predicted acylesterase/phospholipase RssA
MKVLITSGGGAKGAFSVGVLRFLKNEMNIDHFDIISGTSTGALIASLASIGRVDELVAIYRSTTNADILSPQNIVNSISNGDPFIFDTEPLLRQIRTHINQATFDEIMNSSTTLYLNSVSLQTGRITVFSTKDALPSSHYERKSIHTMEEFFSALLASSNQAVFMNPIDFGTEQYVDGGNREVIPTRVVCTNLALNEDHEIYILSNNPNELVALPGKRFSNILDVLMRAISIFIQEIRENDLELIQQFKALSTGNVKIFYLCPAGELDKEFPTGLRFDKGKMLEWMFEGEELAKEIITTTPAGNFPAFHLSRGSFA